MLTCIDVKFIFDSVRLGLSSSANILQITDVPPAPSCLLGVFAMFFAIICLVPALVLTLEMSEMPGFFFTTKTTQPRPQVFSLTVL